MIKWAFFTTFGEFKAGKEKIPPPRSCGRISFQDLGWGKDKDFLLEYAPMVTRITHISVTSNLDIDRSA